MADAYTTTANLGTSLVQKAYDKLVESQNRHAVVLRRIADKRPGDLTNPGAPVVLQRFNDLTAGSRELTDQVVDPDAVAVPATTTLEIAYREFGNVVISSRKLHHLSLTQVDPIVANVLARDIEVSLDDEVGTKLYAGTKVTYGGTGNAATADVATGDVIDSDDVRTIVNRLRVRAAAPRKENLFVAYVHPNVAYDLRKATGAGEWRDDHKYTSPDMFWAGEIGVYEGAAFIESSRMKNATDGTASAVVYRSLFAGAQALAEVVWEEPHTVLDGVIVNKLKRLNSVGWYAAVNWGIYRDDNLHRLETAATLSPTA